MRKESRLWALFRRRQLENDLADEIEFHVEQRTAELMREGLSPVEAQRRARVELGTIETYKEQCREAKGLALASDLRADIRYAFRTLRRSMLFTTVAVITLALGIAVNASIFSVLDHVALRPLPFPDPHRLVLVWTAIEHQGSKFMTSFPSYVAWRAKQDVFIDLGATLRTNFYIRAAGYPDRLSGYRATRSFFDTLGVQPQLGRLFSAEEERTAHDDVILLSDACWRNRFGRDSGVIGRVIWLARNRESARAYTIIGVLPRELDVAFPRHSEIWAPFAQDHPDAAAPNGSWDVIARLKPRITLAQAEAQMDTLTLHLPAKNPEVRKGYSVTLEGLHENLTGGYVTSMLPVLLGAVGFVLLLACVNVLNLFLARGAEREREIATRASLGAGPFRIFRQLLTESVVLAICAGAAATALSYMAAGVIRSWIPDYVLRRDEISVDARVLLFTLSVTLLAAILAGMLPAFRGSSLSLNRYLRTGRSTGARHGSRLHSALVVAEIAIGLVLLAGSGLMINTFIRLLNVDSGFDQHNLLAVESHLSHDAFKDEKLRYSTVDRLIEGMRQIGGVEYVGVTDYRPLNSTMNVLAARSDAPSTPLAFNAETVSGDYFAAMGIRHLHGRSFNRHDRDGSPLVALINQTAADRYWSGENPIGRRLRRIGAHGKEWTIVGVVGDVRRSDIGRPAEPAIYLTQAQSPSTVLEVIVRTRDGVAPAEIVDPVRRQMASIHPSLAADRIDVMSEVVAGYLARHRFMASFMSVFGVLAVVLTASGIFGVMAYTVRLRNHEMAVRLALGARTADIFRLVVGQGAVWTGAGLAIGLAGAFATAGVLKAFLYGIEPHDPPTFAGAVILLGLTALVAAWLPSRQASRVDPADTLRME